MRVKQRQDEQAAILCPGSGAMHLVIGDREGAIITGRAARDHDVCAVGLPLPTPAKKESASLQRKGLIMRPSQGVDCFGRDEHGGRASRTEDPQNR
jgi:hypothetical protein